MLCEFAADKNFDMVKKISISHDLNKIVDYIKMIIAYMFK